ncbi:uncharacterized protein MEPE_02530 [Melanopsichium pennsylvanicum]|uniref:Uncharacterized protein n=2 Tax=Melanopsichium pennsylvanicum TaxID=63383 RepID=A0AAJ5C4M5_9BASI|nr:conserved hypothetical protein [Melanopsichium pennsylvanicum 4]SNX83822.1 uncharacterized protein MEPE_02530 [Melanopsichium pennsylvanicum]
MLSSNPSAVAMMAKQSSIAVIRGCAASYVRTYVMPSSSSSASQPSSSRSSSSRRSARFTARPGADMVGPPDPISNLRPVRYGSAFEESSSSSPSSAESSSAAALSMSHPYSLHEFTTSGDSTFGGWSGSAHNRRSSESPSLYFERLLAKLEEAELAHKLRMARADNFNQRFWQDNNARFIQALSEFRSRTGSSKAVATLPSARSADGNKEKVASSQKHDGQESELDLDSDSLATFYSAWLKANAARHRAYNRQLWRQTFGDLAPAARYQCLRAWAKCIGSFERKLGRIN